MAAQALSIRRVFIKIDECASQDQYQVSPSEICVPINEVVTSNGETYLFSPQSTDIIDELIKYPEKGRVEGGNNLLTYFCDYSPMGEINIDVAIADICARHERDIELLARQLDKPVAEIRAMAEQWRAGRREFTQNIEMSATCCAVADNVNHKGVGPKSEAPRKRAKSSVLNPWADRKGEDRLLSPPAFIRKYYAEEISLNRLTKTIIEKDPGLKTQLREWRLAHPDEPLGFVFVTPRELRDRDDLDKLGEEAGERASRQRRIKREYAQRRSGSASARPKRANRPKAKVPKAKFGKTDFRP